MCLSLVSYAIGPCSLLLSLRSARSRISSLCRLRRSPALPRMQLYDVIQSPQDHRLYRRYALANGLQVLLVSDPEISLSNTGVDVDAVRSASGSESGAEDADETVWFFWQCSSARTKLRASV